MHVYGKKFKKQQKGIKNVVWCIDYSELKKVRVCVILNTMQYNKVIGL